ncbi:twin-arginine translocase TatA/TatE family subunit [Roseivirga sp. BDSF3-8]|uniref:twin-arginine translocase TatA/TatE family subunit n=1 Tax=Roseivirga sp. BDSF3-8 TaxID=3241598 RepID=UPI003531C9F1
MQMVFLFLGGLGGWEVFLIIAVLVLLFGAKKIPELARGMGRGIREFKDATKEIKDEIDYRGDEDSSSNNSNRKHAPSATTHADQASTGSTQTEKTAN